MQVRTPRTRRDRARRGAAALGTLALLGAATPVSADVTQPAAGSATFVNYTAPGALARGAAEPTLGVNWKTGKVLFQAYTETDQVTFDDSTLPATASWKDVSRPPTSIISLDPILETDPVTGRTLVSQLAPPCSIAAYTDSDGEPTATNPNGYVPSAACGVGSNFDHQTVHFGKAVNPQLSPLYGPGRVAWYCSQVVVQSSCSVSRNGGVAFETSRPAYTFKGDLVTADMVTVGCEGLHGHLNTSPVDGTAYLPNFACNSAADLQTNRPAVVVSPDEGLNWTIRQIPDGTSPNFDSDPAVDVDETGRAYVAYENATGNLLVATTTDRGATFTPSVDLGEPYRIKNGTMPTVQAGSDGRAAVAFLGTVAEAPLNNDKQPENQLLSFDPDGNDPAAGWHLYVAMTYDGGANWTTSDLTPNDPVQRGCIWWGSAIASGGAAGPACANNKRNLLDFIDVAVDKAGRVVVGWADGCVKACVTEGHTRNTNLTFANREARDQALTQQAFDELYSQEDIGVISRQSCGLGLYAAFDAAAEGPSAICSKVSDAAPVKPPVTTAGTGAINLVSAKSGPGSSPITPVLLGSARSLPSTGGAPLLAIVGVVLLGAVALTRRRA